MPAILVVMAFYVTEEEYDWAGIPIKTCSLNEFHGSLLGGHAGIHRTFMRLSANVY